ncbi:MAG: AAA family ATPase [Pseudomonadota bacterium]
MKQDTIIRHAKQDVVKTALMCGNVALVGPAGSGKTTMASKIAEEMGLDFYFTGAVLSEHKLVGFIDARGKVVRTPFRDAFENGGLFLFDEVDASAPTAVLALNAALSNGKMDFPDACVDAHADFKVIAASNTFWTGADRTYVGRNQLDGATLDRFIMIGIDYDEEMERKLAGNDEWTDFVQKVRAAVKDMEIRHVVSPRAAIMGAKLLEEGMSLSEVKEIVLWKGLPSESVEKIEHAIDPEVQAEAERKRREEEDEARRRQEMDDQIPFELRRMIGHAPPELVQKLMRDLDRELRNMMRPNPMPRPDNLRPEDWEIRHEFIPGRPDTVWPIDAGQEKPFKRKRRK